jgi:predicted phosphodiesterase
MAGRPPEDRAKEFAKDTLTMTTYELSQKYGIAESTVRDWRLYCKRQMDLEVGYGKPAMTFINKKDDPGPIDDEDLWALLEKLTDRRELERKAQDELEIVLDENLPHAIALTGDWHIGVEGVLMQELNSDVDALAGLPGLLALGLGDYAHNPKAKMRPGENLYRMIAPDPDVQYRMAMYQMQKLAGQWIGLIKGCHDDWDAQIAGYERVADLARSLGTAYLGHGAVITVRLGEQVYKILARHKYKFESSINITNAQRRAWEQIDQVDAVVFGHLHHNVTHKEPRGKQDVIYMRSGSYFHWDEFGMKVGHYKGQRGIPILVIYPDQHRVVPFYGPDMDQAIRFLEAERAYYRQ